MATLIFLSGGSGTRMGSQTPKQYLPLQNKPIALHSFEIFQTCPEITQIVVVCEPQYQHFFPASTLFATPGPRRQDSVYSGLLKSTEDLIVIHDAARPFFEKKYLPLLLDATRRTGAAALATPITSTVKQCDSDRIVKKTLDRSQLWDIQTPQALKRSLLFQAFETVQKHNLSVTDDLSLAEAIGHPAELVPCSPRNMKITTPFDLSLAEFLCATN